MNKAEKELISATKEFAKLHNLSWDRGVESMVLNAYREGKCNREVECITCKQKFKEKDTYKAIGGWQCLKCSGL